MARTGTRAGLAELRSAIARTAAATELATAPGRAPADLIEAVEGPPPLPTDPGLAGLLPGGGLRRGAVYRVTGATSLLFRLLARPTREGLWCALVGLPHLGYEAAAQAGVRLDRLVVVPQPGPRWSGILGTLVDALPLVAVRPPAPPPPAVAARLAARARHHGAVVLVLPRADDAHPWPQTTATVAVERQCWGGLGSGHGHLGGQQLAVAVTDRAGIRRAGVLGAP